MTPWALQCCSRACGIAFTLAGYFDKLKATVTPRGSIKRETGEVGDRLGEIRVGQVEKSAKRGESEIGFFKV
jgi:hypothetical protein